MVKWFWIKERGCEKCPSLPLQFCELSGSVNENAERKKDVP